ncbi:hypothetical protein C9I57_21475 [Trinickia symbiotica]|uniref:Transcriptional regulator n=1 Tax=Trinickia symbiotica TaxID=863227 RepID=A0A2T3XQ01_9BURK|nr:hypothetical protein C9I57_21475 [Trinickia symbiotica]
MVSERFRDAFRGVEQGAFISFVSVDLVLESLTPPRWEILELLAGRGDQMVLDVAEIVGRALDAVIEDMYVCWSIAG